ncbi:MAG TPA: MG2 domain-containing protein [Elusimicrobiales bacterium]|nr:MG2 domain-containing protein [Elusimicrobiales bacterium]
MKLFAILLALASTLSAAPAEEKNAADLFEKGRYQEALSYYSKAAAQPGEEGLRAVYRAAECEALLTRYGEAAQRLAAVKLPKDPLWRARLLLLRAETGREFLRQYGYSLPADEQRGSADVTKLTSGQWRAGIGRDYDALWELRHELLLRPLREEAYFVDVKKTTLDYAPTLWDFIVGRWTGYLTEEVPEAGRTRPAQELAVENYKADFSATLGPGAKAAAILEDAAAAPAGRETAAGFWRIKRLLLPQANSGLFTGFAPAKFNPAALEVLKAWAGALPSALARAQAAYEAAAISENASAYAAAVEFCAQAVKLAPGSRPAVEADKIRARIEMPELQLSARPAPPPGKGLLTVTARNLPALYFRLYKTSPEELSRLQPDNGKSFNPLRSLSNDAAESFLAKKQEINWRAVINYPAPYQFKTQEILPPPLQKGLYVLVASGDGEFSPGSSLLSAAVVNVTDIFLLGTSGVKGDPENFVFSDPGAGPVRTERPELFHFYAVNALTGRPLGDAPLEVFHGRNYSQTIERSSLRTDGEGRAAVAETVSVKHGGGQYFQADPLLASGGAYALWAYARGTGFSAPEPVEIRLETDRPVYRPGQKVSFKATVLERVPGGYRVYRGAAKVKVTARDAGWQEFFSKEFAVGPMGSAAGSFELPAGRLLGQYRLGGSLREYSSNFSGDLAFQVEEYKRPEFEVKLKDASGAFRYGQPAKVEGFVKYYFGSPVPDADVKYRVTRSRYVPWYAWWWNWCYAPAGNSEFAAGTARTDAEGRFTVEFTPGAESEAYAQYPSSFRVEAEARDAGGRTITDARSYNAGAKAYNFDITPDAGFFTADKKAGFQARLMNLNDVQSAGSGGYEVLRLEKTPDFPPPAAWGGQFGHNPSLEQVFDSVPDGAVVARGDLDFSAGAPTAVKLKALPEGVYRLRLKAKDPWGGESASAIILVSADPAAKTSSLKLPPVALFERASYQPGETARALVGAAALKGVKYAEVLAGDFILEQRTIDKSGVSLLSFKVDASHRGGFALRWFGAGDFGVYSAMAGAAVPRADRKLSVSLAYDKTLKPGQEASWALKAADASGKPAEGEGTVRIFDRSLEYYARAAGGWQEALYPARFSYSGGTGSLFAANFTQFPIRTGLISRMYELFNKAAAEEEFPSLRINSSRAGRGGWGRFFSKGMAFESNELMADSALMETSLAGASMGAAPVRGGMARAKSVAAPQAALMKEEKDSAEPEAAAVRKDFSETAYFNPQLKITRGSGPFSFRIPERLTSWKISAAVITPDVKTGNFSAETVTRKELMARLDIPRFLREGDRSEITAVLSSQAELELSGEAALEVSLDGQEAAQKFGLAGLTKSFTLKPGATVALRWPVTAPAGMAAYKARIVARAGAFSDAQENDLPVLPSRERLIASRVTALNGKAAEKLTLTELEKEDPAREMESLHLEVQPQLILTVLNSLPFLVQYPYECTDQLLNRYVPLAITNSFYKKYPELAAAVKNIPRRATLTPAWERDNPVRLMTLMETPWEETSQGTRSSLPSIDLLDPKVVGAEKESSLNKLVSYQNSDGSFPWFPGGHASLYMTLYVLDGMAEAARYGVEIPRGAAQKALRYVLAEIPGHMKPEPGETSFLLYAAYVVTSFPADWPESRTAAAYARKWAQYADKYSNALTAFGKAYASQVWLRLGDRPLSESYLARAMDGAREDAVSGVYWTPEKISWLWYNDTVEKHAFLLRTLLAVRPADARVPGMVKWLLFSRKAGVWKSTKASAAAIYSLLDVMKKKGALDRAEKLDIKWGEVSEARELKPFDWVQRPLRWSRYGEEARRSPVTAKVAKDGPGLAFASLTGIYTTSRPAEESPAGMMNVSRRYFSRVKEGETYALKPLASGDTVAVGDQLEVQLTVNTRSQFEYVHLKDPRGAGFEGEGLLSGWRWDQLSRYEEPRDSLTNFFVEWLPHGEYVLKYRLRPTTPGTYRIGAAVLQSMYAPEFAAHSAGMELTVK